jgi:hypothetical protein
VQSAYDEMLSALAPTPTAHIEQSYGEGEGRDCDMTIRARSRYSNNGCRTA